MTERFYIWNEPEESGGKMRDRWKARDNEKRGPGHWLETLWWRHRDSLMACIDIIAAAGDRRLTKRELFAIGILNADVLDDDDLDVIPTPKPKKRAR